MSVSIQKVLDTFSMSIDKFHEIQTDCQRFLQDMNSEEKIEIRKRTFPYLDLLDPSISVYAQFGADKCSISDFTKWCKLLNVEIPNDQQETFHCVSSDKKITFTCRTLDNYIHGKYIHYFGVTGEYEKVLEAFSLFLEMGQYAELCWGNRDFI